MFRTRVNIVVTSVAMLSRLFCQPSALGDDIFSERKAAIGFERATSCKPKRMRDVCRGGERFI